MAPSLVPLALSIQAAGSTDIGRTREHNEDAILLRDDLQLYIVADGAGGHNAGNVASALATTSIASYFEDTQKEAEAAPVYHAFGFSTGARRLARAIRRANRDIIEIAKSSQRHHGMGTTVVAIWAQPQIGMIHVGHVGDSRCYRYRAGQLEQLTLDHSLYNDVLELQPDLPDAALARLPRNVVTRALGMADTVRPAVQSHHMLPGDKYLLCSDGLTDGLTEPEIAEALEAPGTAEDVVKALVTRAKESVSEDNIAALVLTYEVDAGGMQRGRIPTSPYIPARPLPPPSSRSRDSAAPEIVIMGIDQDPGSDRSAQIYVVPQDSATESLLSAFDSVVARMHPRDGASQRSLPSCSACGNALEVDDVVCPQCNAPQPLADGGDEQSKR